MVVKEKDKQKNIWLVRENQTQTREKTNSFIEDSIIWIQERDMNLLKLLQLKLLVNEWLSDDGYLGWVVWKVTFEDPDVAGGAVPFPCAGDCLGYEKSGK